MKFCVVGGPQTVVLRFEFHQNRLSGFGAVVGGQNLPIPIDLAIGLYNSLYYRTSRDVGPNWPVEKHTFLEVLEVSVGLRSFYLCDAMLAQY